MRSAGARLMLRVQAATDRLVAADTVRGSDARLAQQAQATFQQAVSHLTDLDPDPADRWAFTAVADLGLAAGDLDRAATIALKNAYWNPRPFTETDIRNLLQAAWEGTRPAS